MAGFHLPKFRWLVIGAVAAGGWAMTQEPPKREHWQRQGEVERPKPAPTRTASLERRPDIETTARRPVEMTTSSIPKPEASLARRLDPVAEKIETAPKKAKTTLRTVDKVRMRQDASTSSAVITMLKADQQVTVLTTDGKWSKVTVGEKTGWVRNDYLTDKRAVPAPVAVSAIPRPKADVGPQSSASETRTASAVPVSSSDWGAMRPARAPQGGDCECPYDLMLNGKQCGERSAYAKGMHAACFF